MHCKVPSDYVYTYRVATDGYLHEVQSTGLINKKESNVKQMPTSPEVISCRCR